MNKELGRKITSLTLMTIMLAGGVSFAVPGVMPEAEAANQYLWVSAEDAGGNNFYGGQVLEIVVSDPAINRLDEAYGMPDVTIDGKKVIMAQGVDGSWYAYIADGKSATGIDSNYPEVEDGKGADYGRFCKADTNLEFGPNDAFVSQLIPSESRGVALPHQLGNTTIPGTSSSGPHTYIGSATQSSYTQGTGITQKCDNDVEGSSANGIEGAPGIWLNASAQLAHTGKLATGVNASDQAINNVVREARALSNGTTTDYYGNIALGPNLWPFIQLYDFTRYQSYDLVYERGGNDETIALSFDRPGATNGGGLSFDKDHYGLTHEIGVTIGNNEMNIDPTDEDSWTFGTLPTNATTFYQLFDENGAMDASATAGAIKFTAGTQPFSFDTGVLQIDRNGPEDATNNVLMFQDNGDQVVACSSGTCATSNISTASQAVTFTETGANTGIFTNWDDALKTNMYVNAAADRGTQATFKWDDVEFSVLYMPFWGTIAFNTDGSDGATTGAAIGAEWNSGEIVEIVLDDNDMNLDARSQEQMTVGSNTTIVPAVKIGSPITLSTLDTLTYLDETGTNAITFDENINDTQCSSDYGSAGTAASYVSCYEKYSERAIVTSSTSAITVADNDQLRFVFNGTTVGDLKDLISGANGTAAYTYIQYDFRSLNGGGNDVNYYLNFTIGDDSINSCTANSATSYTNGHCSEARFNTGLIGQTLINDPSDTLKGLGSSSTNALTDSQALRITVQMNSISGSFDETLSAGTSYPLTMDVVTFGQSNDGVASSDRHNNAIYRLEVDEVDANGGIFVGELDFIMLNQLNVNQTSTYNNTKTDHEENRIIVHNDLTDEDEIRIN